MKKTVVFVLFLAFLFVTGMALAGEAGTKDSGAKGGPALNNMANWITSHFPSWERSTAAKEPAPVLSKEELKARRENTGMGMNGRVGCE